MPVIEFANVSKSFPRHTGRMLLRSHVRRMLGRQPANRFFALKNVSFTIRQGENVALVGVNGAGKSTLLSLAVGLAAPDRGTIQVDGRIVGLLELGSGFHADLTGRENVFLNASLLGLTKRKTQQIFDSVVEFSEIGDFIDEPLRTYSSGMMLRLAFSVAVNVDPDFIIVDEVLAVGDQSFQAKCFDKIAEFKRKGKTLLCVSHSAAVVQQLCERALWLDHGELIVDGKTEDVLKMYEGRSSLRPQVPRL
ncbi:MAG: sugar ABC transporter ATP-binding protein [Acidobacteria bacterium]|nr:MAG: sugar ABC transporter ATP-binding protein [Acidobacteriota bacterium]